MVKFSWNPNALYTLPVIVTLCQTFPSFATRKLNFRLFSSSTTAFTFLFVEKTPQDILTNLTLLFASDSHHTIISKYPYLRISRLNIHHTPTNSGFESLYVIHPNCNPLIPGGMTIFSSIFFVIIGSMVTFLSLIKGIRIPNLFPVPISDRQ